MNKVLTKYWVEVLVFLIFMIYSGILNLQFLEGSNINYTFSGHDEYLTVREVYSILNPPSFKHFALSVMAGDIVFYGRAMFYTDALMAWLPFKIWGLTGMVYAIRMTHVVFMIFGLFILGTTFIRSAINKVLFYLGILTLYYSAYFMMIPKPEPMQLFILALFLFYAKRNEWRFGRHYLWLGIAYGLKFNVLMILPLFFLLPLFTESFRLKKAVNASMFFISGVIIALPSLLLAIIRPIYLKSYLASTFGNTKHYDDTQVAFSDWLSHGLFGWYGGSNISGAILFLLFLGALAFSAFYFLRDRKVGNELVLLTIAFCLMMPVMLMTKRLWPHYLWTGFVFMILGIINFLEKKQSVQAIKYLKGLVIGLMFLALGRSVSNCRPLFDLETKYSTYKIQGNEVHSYIRAKQENALILQEIPVYYPFNEFVAMGRYHPFKDPYPFVRPKSEIWWNDFISVSKILALKPNYIVLNKRIENKIRGTYLTSKEKEMVRNDSVLTSLINKKLFLDTIIGNYRLLKVSFEE